MPISLPFELTRVSQAEFGKIAFEVMDHVFAIHNEFGRFINETLVKRELADRMSGVELEVPVTVSHDSFTKTYFLDVLVHRRALFEFKCVEKLHPRHRAQLLNYLLLTGLEHGKLVNTRPEKVEHEFVNCTRPLHESREPELVLTDWNGSLHQANAFVQLLRNLISDWGTGLELSLYQEAFAHCFQGLADVPISGSLTQLGVQSMHLVSPTIAFKLTAFKRLSENFVIHAKRLLNHTPLEAIFWINMTRDRVECMTIQQ